MRDFWKDHNHKSSTFVPVLFADRSLAGGSEIVGEKDPNPR